jgi:hypothetical protein
MGAMRVSVHPGRVIEGSELFRGFRKNPEIGNSSMFRILIPKLVSKYYISPNGI